MSHKLPSHIVIGFLELYPQLTMDQYINIEKDFFYYMNLHKDNKKSFDMSSEQVDCLWHYLIVKLQPSELERLYKANAGRYLHHVPNKKRGFFESKPTPVQFQNHDPSILMNPIIIEESSRSEIVTENKYDTNTTTTSDFVNPKIVDHVSKSSHISTCSSSASQSSHSNNHSSSTSHSTHHSTHSSSCSSGSSCSSASSCSSSSCSS